MSSKKAMKKMQKLAFQKHKSNIRNNKFRPKANKIFEWAGVTTAILYSLFVALNIGIEFVGFSLLLLSAILIGILWNVIKGS